MNENVSISIGIVCVLVLIVLFGGDPDLHDVIIQNLSVNCPEIPEY